MDKASMVKLGEVMVKASNYHKGDVYSSYAECVRFAFWCSFGVNEQSQEMQDVYIALCDMGYTPVAI